MDVGACLRRAADPIDFDGLLSDGDGPVYSGLARETTIGHVHLHVSNLDAAQHFYVDVLGFALMQRYGPSALFASGLRTPNRS